MTSSYNKLNSIKIDLAAIGICPLDGLSFTDPKCIHATPEQKELRRKIDAQVEEDYQIKQAYRNRTITYTAPAAKDETPGPVLTSYTPSPKELSRRSYKGLHVPSHTCPRCGLVLTVNEKEYKTTDPDAPHYERRLTCPNFFITGCNHREDFTAEIKAELDAVVQVDVDF